MPEFIITMLLGIVCIVLGVLNMKGNISTLHWYHRKRVAEENRLQFGRLVGLGTIIIGFALIIFAVFTLVATLTSNNLFYTIGGIELIVGVVIGIVISFYAMFKYNKGIF